MATIYLYKNMSDRNVLSKTLAESIAMSGTVIKSPSSVISPVLEIQTATNLSAYNYALLPDFGRYYYINDIISVANGLWQLSLDVDVLMTYAAQIRALTGTVDRNEHLYNGYQADNEYKALQYRQIVTKAFPNAIDNDNLILMTVG